MAPAPGRGPASKPSPRKSPPPPVLAEEGLGSADARPAGNPEIGQNLTVTTECLGITSTAPSATAFFSDLGPLPS